MQVLLFFGQGVKNAKQIKTILQQALVMLDFPVFLIFVSSLFSQTFRSVVRSASLIIWEGG